MIPKEPYILLSFLNTRLRDQYQTLDELVYDLDLDVLELEEAMARIGYEYVEESNQFIFSGKE